MNSMRAAHVYEVRPRKDKRGIDLISDVLPFGRLWYSGPNAVANAIGYAEHYRRSHDVRVCDSAGNVIETHKHAGDFKEGRNKRYWVSTVTSTTMPFQKRLWT